jgi:hypothetical protein
MKDQLPMNGCADIENAAWIVNMQGDDGGSRRVTVQALSEMGAIIEAEERFAGTAISARLKAATRDERPHGCSKDCAGRMCRDALNCDAKGRRC